MADEQTDGLLYCWNKERELNDRFEITKITGKVLKSMQINAPSCLGVEHDLVQCGLLT
jgi:hypothetical protein